MLPINQGKEIMLMRPSFYFHFCSLTFISALDLFYVCIIFPIGIPVPSLTGFLSVYFTETQIQLRGSAIIQAFKILHTSGSIPVSSPPNENKKWTFWVKRKSAPKVRTLSSYVVFKWLHLSNASVPPAYNRLCCVFKSVHAYSTMRSQLSVYTPVVLHLPHLKKIDKQTIRISHLQKLSKLRA